METNFNKFFITNFFLLCIFLIAVWILFFIVITKNPINIILLLISLFINLAFLFIFCGADYLAILFLILYGGAISIILLFVVMLLDMKDLILEKEKIAKFLIYFYIIFLLFFFFKAIFLNYYIIINYIPRVLYIEWIELFYELTNIEVIGTAFYEYYLFQFVIIGVFLFLIMITIISLVVNYNMLTKRQIVSEQLNKKNILKI